RRESSEKTPGQPAAIVDHNPLDTSASHAGLIWNHSSLIAYGAPKRDMRLSPPSLRYFDLQPGGLGRQPGGQLLGLLEAQRIDADNPAGDLLVQRRLHHAPAVDPHVDFPADIGLAEIGECLPAAFREPDGQNGRDA